MSGPAIALLAALATSTTTVGELQTASSTSAASETPKAGELTSMSTATPTVSAPAPAPHKAQSKFAEHWWMSFGSHVSFFGDLIDRSTLQLRFGYGFHVGYRYDRWGYFLQVQQDIWTKTEVEFDLERGVVNWALGTDYRYFDGRARAALAVGISILAQDQAFDKEGSVGLYFEFRPVGLMFEIADLWTARFDPLFFAVEAPVIAERSLTEIQYRSAVTIEYDL